MGERIAIVIFGAAVWPDGTASPTLRRRVEAAFAFGKLHDRTLYVPTGAIGRYGPSEAKVMADLLCSFGVPAERIWLEETGVNTLTSAFAASRLLRAHSGQIYAASSRYHLPRCRLLMRLAGSIVYTCPAQPPPEYTQWRRWLREAVALPVDLVRGMFHRAFMSSPASDEPYQK